MLTESVTTRLEGLAQDFLRALHGYDSKAMWAARESFRGCTPAERGWLSKRLVELGVDKSRHPAELSR